LKTNTKHTDSSYTPSNLERNKPDIFMSEKENSTSNTFESDLLSACLEFGKLANLQEQQNRAIENLEREINFLECDLHDVRNDAFEYETEEISSRNFRMGFTVELNETTNREPTEEEIPSRNAWLKVERAKSDFNRKMLEATSTSTKLEAAQINIKDLSKQFHDLARDV